MPIDTKNKLAGILVPVFALRHDNDFGVGDTRAMREAIEFCAENSIGVLQVLPINETGGDNSPYNALSSVALDPIYIELSPNVVPGLTAEKIAEAVSAIELKELRQGCVDYGKVKRLKAAILLEGFAAFERDDIQKSSQAAKELVEFERANKRWLEPYTLFRTLVEEHNGDAVWTRWEEELHSYAQAIKVTAVSPRAKEIERSRQFWSYVQWVAFKQWQDLKKYADARNVELMGDMPFGVSRYSADVWAERKIFDLDWSGGAPPETYFQGDKFVREWGQNWGVPLYNWEENRKENFAWWRQRVENLCKLFHYFRIDHVLGFFRVYSFPWIPERNHEFIDLTKEEASEITGGRLPHFMPRSDEDADDALANAAEGRAIMNVLIDAAGSNGIVAEDLGMVPEYVRPLLHEIGIPGFAIPIFERVEEDRSFKRKETLHELSLATYGTHDHQPLRTFYEELVKWWQGPDGHEGWLEIQRLMAFLDLDEEHPPKTFSDDLHKTLLRALLETPCWLALVMITDLLGTSQRFNEPGLSGDYNWSQRLSCPLSKYAQDAEFGDKIRYFRALIKQTDRAPLVSAKA